MGTGFRTRSCSSKKSAVADRQGDEAGVVTLLHPYQHAALAFRTRAGNHLAHVGGRRNGLAGDFQDYIAGRKTAFVGDTGRIDAGDDRPLTAVAREMRRRRESEV